MFAGLLYRVRLSLRGGIRVRFTQSDALPYADSVRLFLLEIFHHPLLLHRRSERLYGLRLFALLCTPLLVSLVEVRLGDGLAAVEHAYLAHEALEHVRLRPVGRRGSLDRRGRPQAVLVPLDAAHDGPSEHARQLLAELIGEVGVRILPREALVERDQPHTVPYGLGPVGDLRLVVRRKPDLELRPVAERFPVRRAGADRVVARDLLDYGLLQ